MSLDRINPSQHKSCVWDNTHVLCITCHSGSTRGQSLGMTNLPNILCIQVVSPSSLATNLSRQLTLTLLSLCCPLQTHSSPIPATCSELSTSDRTADESTWTCPEQLLFPGSHPITPLTKPIASFTQRYPKTLGLICTPLHIHHSPPHPHSLQVTRGESEFVSHACTTTNCPQ